MAVKCFKFLFWHFFAVYWPWPLCAINRYINPRHEISNNVVCATYKGSGQPAHTRSLARAFASRLNILGVLSY